jgi:RNA-directed DNA polymerase
MWTGRGRHETREAPNGGGVTAKPDAREGQAGLLGVAERPVVPTKPGNAGGGKGPWFEGQRRKECAYGRLAMSLAPPATVEKLQTALHAKAKASPQYRFYALYDKVYRQDVLAHAYERCRANQGAPGVDGQTFDDIETYGRLKWLGELSEDLRKKTYQAQAVRRVWIPKPDGKQRPLGVPTVRDRVVQMAAVLVLEPIFEADLQPEQYAYRSGKSALDAVREVHSLVNDGHTEVVDADLSGYFDSIPHQELMKSVARRVSDGALLHLIKMWLVASVEEVDERGRRQRTTPNKDTGRGTPQGAVISPLLANLYMRRFVLGWKVLGHDRRLGAQLVNYADDFVICCRGTGAQALAAMRAMMTQLKLTVNETKTRLCSLPGEAFNFLGYTIGRCYSPQTGRAYLGTKPSAKKVQKLVDDISDCTSRASLWREPEELIGRLNQKLVGWANYFRLGPVTKAYERVNRHVCQRLRRWLCRKHKRVGRGYRHYPDRVLHDHFGLVRLVWRPDSPRA